MGVLTVALARQRDQAVTHYAKAMGKGDRADQQPRLADPL